MEIKKIKKIALIVFILVAGNIFSQPEMNEPEMADKFFAEGKIYVVIAVTGILLIGMFIYLALLDRKLTRIEKEMKNKN